MTATDVAGSSSGSVALLRSQLVDDVPPQVADGTWLLEYLNRGCPAGPPIMLSLGEPWTGPSPELLEAVARAPAHSHGYQLSAHGLPRLRRALMTYLARSYGLGDRDLERMRIAVSWGGTRNTMFDFGRLLRRLDDDPRTPVVLAPAPGWDYAGIFEPLGFETRFFTLPHSNRFRPGLADLVRPVSELRDSTALRLAVVIVNAQHNPTGVDWGEPFVSSLLSLAFEFQAALLLDDAHYSLHEPRGRPTSAVRLLCRRLRAAPAGAPWLATRSLGKEFDCNGWAIGAMLGEPRLVDALVQEVAQEHQYNCGGALQWALAEWLEKGPVDAHLARRRGELAEKRRAAREALLEMLDYPPGLVDGDGGGPFLLFPVPRSYAGLEDGVTLFRRSCFERTGVLFSDAWPLARVAPQHGSLPYVRMYLGGSKEAIVVALARMRDAGFVYDAER
jgi:aspartate/methionine/tyrosine aminotransferase